MFDWLLFGPMILGLSLWYAVFFWAVLAVLFIELAFDNGAAATASLAAAIIVSYLLDFWTIDFVIVHQRAFLWMLAFYVPIGIVWSTLKWWLYCSGVASKVRYFLSEREIAIRKRPNVTTAEIENQMHSVRNDVTNYFEPLPPRVSRHKSDLMRWMAWWPLSIISSMFDDLLRRVFTAIYNGFADVWQAISAHTFRNVQYQNAPAERDRKTV